MTSWPPWPGRRQRVDPSGLGTDGDALSRTGALYSEESVAWMLKHAGWHIIEAGEEGQAVYRLAHQLFADHYRRGVDSRDANARITKALAAGIKGKDWLDADGYLWRHLASHAAAGGLLDALVTDAGYLAVADPIRLCRHSRLWLMTRRGRSRTCIGASPTNF